jgi:hypothetical protein
MQCLVAEKKSSAPYDMRPTLRLCSSLLALLLVACAQVQEVRADCAGVEVCSGASINETLTVECPAGFLIDAVLFSSTTTMLSNLSCDNYGGTPSCLQPCMYPAATCVGQTSCSFVADQAACAWTNACAATLSKTIVSVRCAPDAFSSENTDNTSPVAGQHGSAIRLAALQRLQCDTSVNPISVTSFTLEAWIGLERVDPSEDAINEAGIRRPAFIAGQLNYFGIALGQSNEVRSLSLSLCFFLHNVCVFNNNSLLCFNQSML